MLCCVVWMGIGVALWGAGVVKCGLEFFSHGIPHLGYQGQVYGGGNVTGMG